MRKRPFGMAMDPVSELSLGTWGLSGDGYGPVSERVQDEVIERAVALGVTLIETADVYGAGAMETKLGQRLAAHPQVRVVTKIGTDLKSQPTQKNFSAQYVREACEASADRLKQGRLDGVLLHNPAAKTVEQGEACDVLREMMTAGTIRSWGVSAGSPEVARAALGQKVELLEVAYNALLGGQFQSLDLDPNRVGILARSVLAYGLLCGQWPSTKTFRDGDHRRDRWTEEEFRGRLKQLTALSGVLSSTVTTLRCAALRYVLSNQKVSSAVLGPRSKLQLDQLLREAGSGPEYLEPGQLRGIEEGLRALGGYS